MCDLFISKVEEHAIHNDGVFEHCANFNYKIAIIALNGSEDHILAEEALERALDYINSVENPGEEILKLKNQILDYFE